VTAWALEAALNALGIDCAVEAHDRLAVLVPRGPVPDLTGAQLRRSALTLATEHGFTHVALELREGGAIRAPLPRD
jgi:hypothetical protein